MAAQLGSGAGLGAILRWDKAHPISEPQGSDVSEVWKERIRPLLKSLPGVAGGLKGKSRGAEGGNQSVDEGEGAWGALSSRTFSLSLQ